MPEEKSNFDIAANENTSVETAPESTSKTRNKLEDRFMEYDKLFDVLEDHADAKALATAIGYGEEKVKAGKALLDKAKALTEEQRIAQGRSLSMNQALRELKDEVKREYMFYLTAAKTALADDVGLLDAVEARGRRAIPFNSWASQVTIFYENIVQHEGVKAKIVGSSIEEKKVKASHKKFLSMMELYLDKEQQRTTAKMLTKEKESALKVLRHWVAEYRAHARSAYLREPVKRLLLGV